MKNASPHCQETKTDVKLIFFPDARPEGEGGEAWVLVFVFCIYFKPKGHIHLFEQHLL